MLKKIKIALGNKQRYLYAVINGVYKGEWLVQMEKNDNTTTFISLPDKYKRIIPNKDIDWGLKNDIIEVVDVLPKRVYNVCLNEYLYGKTKDNTSNRRKQYNPSSTLDCEESVSRVK